MRPESILVLLLSVACAAADALPPEAEADDEPDRMPLHTVVPTYPEDARRERLEGEVQVCFNIDKHGKPYRVAVRKSSHRIFERPAMLAIKASAYVPLAPGEETSGIKTCRTFRFTLQPVQDAG